MDMLVKLYDLPPSGAAMARLREQGIAIRRAPEAKGETYIVNVSGRGDKDIDIYRENFPELDAE